MQNILGIDVSKDKHDVVLVSEERKRHLILSNDTKGFEHLERWLKSHRVSQMHACMEATGQYGEALAEYLYEQGHMVSVVNPARIKRYGESKLHRNKTDKADADLIAEFCLKEKPAFWKPLSPEIKQLRALTRRLQALKANLHQEKNRKESGEKDTRVLEDIDMHIEFLNERIETINKEIHELIKQKPVLKSQHDLLTSIPGIAHLTAITLIAEIGDFSAFENAPQLAAYAGLNPQGHRSGSSVFKKTQISKQGRSELRQCLFMPALVALQWNPIVQSLAERMTKTNHHRKEIVIAAMRKLLHLAYGVKQVMEGVEKQITAFRENFLNDFKANGFGIDVRFVGRDVVFIPPIYHN
jgi:transposase